MKNAAKRIFTCKNRCRYSRKRATFCRNFAKNWQLPYGYKMPYDKSIHWAATTFPKGARPWASSFGVPGVVAFVGGILEENVLKTKMPRANSVRWAVCGNHWAPWGFPGHLCQIFHQRWPFYGVAGTPQDAQESASFVFREHLSHFLGWAFWFIFELGIFVSAKRIQQNALPCPIP